MLAVSTRLHLFQICIWQRSCFETIQIFLGQTMGCVTLDVVSQWLVAFSSFVLELLRAGRCPHTSEPDVLPPACMRTHCSLWWVKPLWSEVWTGVQSSANSLKRAGLNTSTPTPIFSDFNKHRILSLSRMTRCWGALWEIEKISTFQTVVSILSSVIYTKGARGGDTLLPTSGRRYMQTLPHLVYIS